MNILACVKSTPANLQRLRCSLCDTLFRNFHYLFNGKSIHEYIRTDEILPVTYAECLKKYCQEYDESNQMNFICLTCCESLKSIHLCHLQADELTRIIQDKLGQTKRLKQLRNSNETDFILVKDEPTHCDQSDSTNYSQFLIDNHPSSIDHQIDDSDDDDDDNDNTKNDKHSLPRTKPTRISRRQYQFLIELPDQQSLNSFIENAAAQSNSRWTWRRTSANSRGYKIYYVCNYSMRRHFHPCSAAMYALFNPTGSISIYAHGEHRHIPKAQISSAITEQSKSEIFKCLQMNFTATEIRELLVQLKLPFGDAKKLNNFIKYHKEILRYGAVTNVRLCGSAYRQPQYWTVRHSSSNDVNPIRQE